MRRYQIWDKQSPVLTPSGAIFSAEQWIEKYPIATDLTVGVSELATGTLYFVYE